MVGFLPVVFVFLQLEQGLAQRCRARLRGLHREAMFKHVHHNSAPCDRSVAAAIWQAWLVVCLY
jgi:hypothetical protein